MTKLTINRRLGLALFLLASLSCASGNHRQDSSTITLVTEKEAAQPDAPPERNREVCTPKLPSIQIKSPREGQTYQQTVPVDIRFLPSEGARIDMSKVSLKLLKLVKVDLTKRLQGYITPTGVSLPGAKIPAGTHRVEIAIADTSGQGCSSVVQFTVTR